MLLSVIRSSVKGILNNEIKIIRSFIFLAGVLAVSVVSPNAARADEVFIAGFTNGCFGTGCAAGASATIPGLTYSNSTFSGTTANGFRGLGGNANPGANVNNLGSLTLSTAPNTFNTTFRLQVTFTAPQGISGSPTTNLTATVTGTVRAADDGGVFLDFTNTPVQFIFGDTTCGATTVPGQQTTCGGGSFSFALNDVAIDPGQTSPLTGQITNARQSTVTAATASFGGRIETPDSGGLLNALVILTDSRGAQQSILSGINGSFRFDDLAAGETYIVSVASKRFIFPTQVVFTGENIDDIVIRATARSGFGVQQLPGRVKGN